MSAGLPVITGSYAGTIACPVDEALYFGFADWPEMSLRLAARPLYGPSDFPSGMNTADAFDDDPHEELGVSVGRPTWLTSKAYRRLAPLASRSQRRSTGRAADAAHQCGLSAVV